MNPKSRLKPGLAVLLFIATLTASYGVAKTRLVTNLEEEKEPVLIPFGTKLTVIGAWGAPGVALQNVDIEKDLKPHLLVHQQRLIQKPKRKKTDLQLRCLL